jgi:GNAT superfamily N-acetyltransferase
VIQLERVSDTLPAGLDELRAEAHTQGYRMLDTLATEWAGGANRFNRPGEVLFAAYFDDVLAGIGGLTLEPAIPNALRMRRFYVRTAYRRSGVGRTLAATLLGEPRRSRRTVTANAAAGSEEFWEALGFVPDRRDGRTHILNR